MSRGLGQLQRRILATLADDAAGGWLVSDLIEELLGEYSPTNSPLVPMMGSAHGWTGYYSRAASMRRALAALKVAGLVKCDRYYPNRPGCPRVWELTDAGRTLVTH